MFLCVFIDGFVLFGGGCLLLYFLLYPFPSFTGHLNFSTARFTCIILKTRNDRTGLESTFFLRLTDVPMTPVSSYSASGT